MFLILVTFQIINSKTIGDILEHKKCYQYGGKTLVPMAKHSVSEYSIVLESAGIRWLKCSIV